MSNKITYERLTEAVKAIAAAVIAVALLFGWISQPAEDNAPTARGTSNFGSIALSDDLVVGDDASIAGDLAVTGATTLGSGSLYPLLINDSSEALYVGSTTITGTLAITNSTHGLTTVTAAVCTLGATPATGAGDGALCWVGVSGGTATITVEQDDWTTNATNSVVVNYAIVGTP